jgi:protein-tyrosine phosphatase
MYALLDASYADGVRTLCLTPHLYPLYYGNNRAKAIHAFSLLSTYAAEKYPDMNLHLACELGYHTDCIRLLETGKGLLLGDRYVLLDFAPNAALFTVKYAVEEMLSAGYLLLLAHVERYECLYGKESLLREWSSRGVRLQVNATSFLSSAKRSTRRRLKKLMRHALIHVVASDTHDRDLRATAMREAEEAISMQFGREIAELLLHRFPERILSGKRI